MYQRLRRSCLIFELEKFTEQMFAEYLLVQRKYFLEIGLRKTEIEQLEIPSLFYFP